MFKDKLKELRKNKKLTQRQIANELDMSQQNYQKWESGKSEPSRETLEKLADFFGVSTDYLLGREKALFDYTPVFKTVGENVKAQRLAKGWSQRRLAKIIGTDINTIKAIEDGQELIGSDIVDTLAYALEIPIDYLLGNNPEIKKIVEIGKIIEKADTNPYFSNLIDNIVLGHTIYNKVTGEISESEMFEEIKKTEDYIKNHLSEFDDLYYPFGK